MKKKPKKITANVAVITNWIQSTTEQFISFELVVAEYVFDEM